MATYGLAVDQLAASQRDPGHHTCSERAEPAGVWLP